MAEKKNKDQDKAKVQATESWREREREQKKEGAKSPVRILFYILTNLIHWLLMISWAPTPQLQPSEDP